MPAPTKTLWQREPHTEAKHIILKAYLDAWFPIVAGGFGPKGLTYVDAFAGPGEYESGEDGSPVIALQHAYRRQVRGHQKPMRFLMIEDDEKRYKHLERLVGERFPSDQRPKNMAVRIVHGDCRSLLIPALADIGADDGPTFVNFDGWGADLPISLVRHVARRPDGPEVFIFFNTSHFVRFSRNQKVQAGDRLFGTTDWRDVAAATRGRERKAALASLYKDQLVDAGFDYTLRFELVTVDKNSYMLFFATKSMLGLTRMKEAMWKADSYNGSQFRDPLSRHQGQLALEAGADLKDLGQLLTARIEDQGRTSLADLKDFALLDTIYLPSHTKPAVDMLVLSGALDMTSARKHEDKIVSPTRTPRLF